MAANTSWANRGKEAIAKAPLKNLKPIGSSGGSLEKILAYYRFSTPKVARDNVRVLTPNTVFEGTYQGSYKDQFEKMQHKVKTTEGLVALPGCARLDKAFGQVKQGADVQVVYNGKTEIKTGPGAGKSAHSFDIAASETVD